MIRTLTAMAGLALLLLAAGRPALAQDSHAFLHNTNPANPLFECGPQTIGQMGCQAGNRCKCTYQAFGDAMRGLPPGYRWDCGLENGSCLVDVPAQTSGQWGNPPPPSPTPQPIVPYQAPGTTPGTK